MQPHTQTTNQSTYRRLRWRQLAGAITQALLGERAAMRAERVGHDRLGPGLEVVHVHLLDRFRRLDERPRRPQRQGDIEGVDVSFIVLPDGGLREGDVR